MIIEGITHTELELLLVILEREIAVLRARLFILGTQRGTDYEPGIRLEDLRALKSKVEKALV